MAKKKSQKGTGEDADFSPDRMSRMTAPRELENADNRERWGLPADPKERGFYLIELNIQHVSGLAGAAYAFHECFERLFPAKEDQSQQFPPAPVKISKAYFRCKLNVQEWQQLIIEDERRAHEEAKREALRRADEEAKRENERRAQEDATRGHEQGTEEEATRGDEQRAKKRRREKEARKMYPHIAASIKFGPTSKSRLASLDPLRPSRQTRRSGPSRRPAEYYLGGDRLGGGCRAPAFR